MDALTTRFGFICTIHKTQTGEQEIYISKKSMDQLRSIVKPHMVPSMLYKIHNSSANPSFPGIEWATRSTLLTFVPLVLTKQENQTKDLLNEDKFNEWFSGFSDGESCFSIAQKSNKPFSF